MKLYSKTIIGSDDVRPPLPVHNLNYKSLELCEFKNDDVFYYDRHDDSLRHLSFDDFINESHWDHVRNTPSVKILIDFSDDYLNIVDIKRFSKTIIEKNINPSQIYLLVMDDNFKQFTIQQFTNCGVSGVNVYHYNLLLKKVLMKYVETYNEPTSYKFSFLSRNYHTWRLSAIVKLIESGVINDFNYSFHNYLPYQSKDVTLDEVKRDIISEGFTIDDTISSWVDHLPYDIGSRHNKWNNVTYDAILSADFHFLIESHYDAFLFKIYSTFKEKYDIEDFSPAFPTEKTWKVIACKKPFITATTPFYLKGIKQLGFKSFSPFIDESYDEIVDNKERMNAVVNESIRISKLPTEDYNKLILDCKEICEYNYQILTQHYNDIKFVNEMEWIKPITY
jgi:hypothetical protein